MKKLLHGLLLLLFLASSNSAIGQSTNVSGTVYDENGEALPGASILIKGTSTGTVSDIDGKFDVNVSDASSILVVSFLGYISQEIDIAGRASIDIKLEADLSELGEVVVVGYGTQKKSDLTGAISTLGGRDIAERRTSQISQALQGAIPGV